MREPGGVRPGGLRGLESDPATLCRSKTPAPRRPLLDGPHAPRGARAAQRRVQDQRGVAATATRGGRIPSMTPRSQAASSSSRRPGRLHRYLQLGSFLIGLVSCALLQASLLACTPEGAAGPAPTTLDLPVYYATFGRGRCCTVIAHAGGAIDGNSYTNSIEAVEGNYALGTRIFEIDFLKTSDGHWVGGHDWPFWQKRTHFEGTVPADLTTFQSLRLEYPRAGWSIAGTYSPITWTWLERFLSEHPDASIITDIKEQGIFSDLVDAILASPVADQFIIQAYYPNQIDEVKSREPAAKVLFTSYKVGRRPKLYRRLGKRREDLVGLTVPMNWANDPRMMKVLRATRIAIYLHGSPANINSRALHATFSAKGIAGFYLD